MTNYPCETFTMLMATYLAGVKAGARAEDDSPAQTAAYSQVRRARWMIANHRKAYPTCRAMTSQASAVRSTAFHVDPREFAEPPLLALMEAG